MDNGHIFNVGDLVYLRALGVEDVRGVIEGRFEITIGPPSKSEHYYNVVEEGSGAKYTYICATRLTKRDKPIDARVHANLVAERDRLADEVARLCDRVQSDEQVRMLVERELEQLRAERDAAIERARRARDEKRAMELATRRRWGETDAQLADRLGVERDALLGLYHDVARAFRMDRGQNLIDVGGVRVAFAEYHRGDRQRAKRHEELLAACSLANATIDAQERELARLRPLEDDTVGRQRKSLRARAWVLDELCRVFGVERWNDLLDGAKRYQGAIDAREQHRLAALAARTGK